MTHLRRRRCRTPDRRTPTSHPDHGPNELEIVARLRRAGCVFAEEEAALILAQTSDPTERESLVAARVAGAPLEHLLGWVDFAGIRVPLDPGVFIPRQRTGYLVERAVLACPTDGVVLDLCCGSGAVGAAILAGRPGAVVHAADLDDRAVTNARRVLPSDQVFAGDLFAALPERLRGTLDVIAVNAPYVPSDAVALMPVESRDFEPLMAVDGGPEGTSVHRRIAADAGGWLSPSGTLLIEAGRDQASSTAALLASVGLIASVHRSEEWGATVVEGRLPR